MKTRCLAFIVASAALLQTSRAVAEDLYILTREIPIGGEGSWDYLSVDPVGRRLYVAHSTKVVAVNIDQEEVLSEAITGTPGVHGFAPAPDLERGFSSNGRDGAVGVFNLKTFKSIKKIPVGENPDAIIYEPGHREVYAFNGRGNSVSIIDGATASVVATTKLPGKPEFAAADPAAGRVYCNLEDKSEVAALDTKTHTLVNTWPIAPGEEASGMAIDTDHHRLFVGCHNEKMLMMDATTGKILDSVPIGKGVDACAFDPAFGLAFSSCGDGTTTIARETGDKLTVVQTLTTQRGARTMALDPKTHRIYLATVQYEAQSDDQTGRPRMIPNTLKVLVYSMATAPSP